MSSLLGYHGFNNWKKMVMEDEEEIKEKIICFGFELEVTTDNDKPWSVYIENNHTPEDLANRLHDELEICLSMKEMAQSEWVLKLFLNPCH